MIVPRRLPEKFKAMLNIPARKPEKKPFVLDYTPSYSGFTRWRSNPNWPGRRAAAALRTAGKTRRMR
jgi:hypothetical protein